VTRLIPIILACAFSLLTGCAVKPAITNQYKLDHFSAKKLSSQQSRQSILISQPEAVAGYQTDAMLYVIKPYEVSSFAHNAWIGPPADMLFPLIMQSVQRSGYFYAVASTPNSDQTDYRLDTQLIELQQDFLKKPSQIHFVAKVVLTHVADNHVVASRVIQESVPCPADTPYGGVIAANQAVKRFTEEMTAFIVNQIRH
jgi:cholesterol transport system auxiliary component